MWSKNFAVASIACLVITQLGAWTIDDPASNDRLSQSGGFFAYGDGGGTELPFEVYLLQDGDEYDNESGTTDAVDSSWNKAHDPTLTCPVGYCAYVLENDGHVRATCQVKIVL